MKVEIEYLSTRQAALRLGVSLGTVQNMVESGVLNAWKTTGGHRRIPLAAVEAMLARRPAAYPGQATGAVTGDKEAHRLDILITEHDKTQQSLYETTISQWNLPVDIRVANNGFDGLLEVGRQTPDILIANLLVPGMDGFQMIRHLHANIRLVEMDIIVVNASELDAMAANELPARIICLGKPVSFDELKGFVLGRRAARQRAAA